MVYFKTAEGCPKLYQRTTEHLWVLLWELLPLSKHHQPDSWVILFYILLRRGGLSEWILCPRTQRPKKYIFFKALWDLKLRCFAALFPQKPGDEGVGLYLQPSFQVSGSQMANIAACCGIGYSLSSNRLHWVICYWIVMGHWLSLPIFFFLCLSMCFVLFCFVLFWFSFSPSILTLLLWLLHFYHCNWSAPKWCNVMKLEVNICTIQVNLLYLANVCSYLFFCLL